jgi:hypothetical protein
VTLFELQMLTFIAHTFFLQTASFCTRIQGRNQVSITPVGLFLLLAVLLTCYLVHLELFIKADFTLHMEDTNAKLLYFLNFHLQSVLIEFGAGVFVDINKERVSVWFSSATFHSRSNCK